MAGPKPWQLRRCAGRVRPRPPLAALAAALFLAGPAGLAAPLSALAFATGKPRWRGRVQRSSGTTAEQSLQSICAADVVEEFRRVQKVNHTMLDWPWARYCWQKADGVKDPTRLPTELVEGFLEGWRRGDFHFDRASEEALSKLNMYKKRKSIQKKWNWYCGHKKRCYGILDPAALPADAVGHFLEHHCSGDPPQWVARPSELAGADLVDRVNSLQREDPTARWPWARFCEEQALGVRAPSQLPTSVVEKFLSEFDQGKFKIELPSEDLLRKLDEKLKSSRQVQRAWNWYTNHHKGCYGVRAPRALPARYVRDFLAQHCPAPVPAQ